MPSPCQIRVDAHSRSLEEEWFVTTRQTQAAAHNRAQVLREFVVFALLLHLSTTLHCNPYKSDIIFVNTTINWFEWTLYVVVISFFVIGTLCSRIC